MQRALTTCLFLLFVVLFAHGQAIDYSNYHIKYTDSFNTYSKPSDPLNSFKNETSAFWRNWNLVEEPNLYGWGAELYDTAHVTMPEFGIIRITENTIDPPRIVTKAESAGRFDTVLNHRSGLLYWKNRVGFGIIEAVIRLPSGDPKDSVEPAFWIPWNGVGYTSAEIDIIDNNPTWTSESTIMYAVFNKVTADCNTVKSSTYKGKDITNFHKYSCEWSPGKVKFYFDGELKDEISYDVQRTYPDLHKLYIHMITKPGAVDNKYLDVSSVTYWEQNTDTATYDIYHPQDYYGSIFHYKNYLQPELIKCKQLSLNVETYSGNIPITAHSDAPTIIEANATIIGSNFLADETGVQSRVVNCPGVLAPFNGYFEIRAPEYLPTKVSEADSLSSKKNQSATPEFQLYSFPSGKSEMRLRYQCNRAGTLSIKIKNNLGKVLVTQNIKCKQGQLLNQKTTMQLPQGIYVAESRINGERHFQKLVKTK